MSHKTKIKKDFLGLYVNAGGFIARPFYGTSYKEGDIVKSHHFGGSTIAGVTSIDQNFKSDGKYETWIATDISSYDYKNKRIQYGFEQLYGIDYKTFEDYLEADTNWCKRNNLVA